MKHDDQNKQTEEKIKKALISLLRTKSIDVLTISDIASKAQVSRGTFYGHYVDKFILLAEIEDDLLQEINEALLPHIEKTVIARSQDEHAQMGDTPYSFVTKIFTLAYTNRELILVLIQRERFLNKIKSVVINAFLYQMEQIKGRREFTNKLPSDYVKEMIVTDILDFTMFWLNKKEPEQPEILAQIFMKSRFLTPYELLGIGENK